MMMEDLSAFEIGMRAERERIRDIINMPEAAGREGIALQCAFVGDMPREAIRFVLRQCPVSAAAYKIRTLIPKHLRLVAAGGSKNV